MEISNVNPSSNKEIKQAEYELMNAPITWCCRVHPTNWFHEVGCSHKEWTKEQLQSALESAKRSHQFVLKQLNEK